MNKIFFAMTAPFIALAALIVFQSAMDDTLTMDVLGPAFAVTVLSLVIGLVAGKLLPE